MSVTTIFKHTDSTGDKLEMHHISSNDSLVVYAQSKDLSNTVCVVLTSEMVHCLHASLTKREFPPDSEFITPGGLSFPPNSRPIY